MKTTLGSLAALVAFGTMPILAHAQSRPVVRAAALQRPALERGGWRDWWTHEVVSVGPDIINRVLPAYLLGTRLQISQTSEGTPLPSGAMSYIDFGAGTNALGVADREFEVPIVQRPLGDLAMGALGALSGGIFTAYEVRFKVNNLNTELYYDTFTPFVGDGSFGFAIALESGNPTVKCEANTLSFLPLGFPIPVGWQDDTCPDAQFRNTRLHIGLVPGLDASGHITIADAQVVLDADIDVSPIDFAEEFVHMKQQLREGFAAQLREKLLEPEFRAVFAGLVTGMLERQRGRPLGTIYGVWVDAEGIHAEVAR